MWRHLLVLGVVASAAGAPVQAQSPVSHSSRAVFRLPPVNEVVSSDPLLVRGQASGTIERIEQPVAYLTDAWSDAGCCDGACGGCDSCGGCGDGCCSYRRCPWLYGASVFMAGDAWMTRLDDDDSNNFGVRTGFNSAFALGPTQWSGQFGAAYGVYDWDGHEQGNTTQNEEQIFVTVGVFRRADPCCGNPWTVGLVLDHLHNQNVGEEHNQSVDLSQFRYRFGYATSDYNEFGIRGAGHVDGGESFLSTNIGPIQVNSLEYAAAYWEHYFDSGATTMVYAGWLSEPGELVLGANGEVPLSERVALYGRFMYGKPSTSAGDLAPNGTEQSYSEAYWNVAFGVVFYMRGDNFNSPLMPVGNNSNFMIQAPVGAL